jgi:hypothetical protein
MVVENMVKIAPELVSCPLKGYKRSFMHDYISCLSELFCHDSVFLLSRDLFFVYKIGIYMQKMVLFLFLGYVLGSGFFRPPLSKSQS